MDEEEHGTGATAWRPPIKLKLISHAPPRAQSTSPVGGDEGGAGGGGCHDPSSSLAAAIAAAVAVRAAPAPAPADTPVIPSLEESLHALRTGAANPAELLSSLQALHRKLSLLSSGTTAASGAGGNDADADGGGPQARIKASGDLGDDEETMQQPRSQQQQREQLSHSDGGGAGHQREDSTAPPPKKKKKKGRPTAYADTAAGSAGKGGAVPRDWASSSSSSARAPVADNEDPTFRAEQLELLYHIPLLNNAPKKTQAKGKFHGARGSHTASVSGSNALLSQKQLLRTTPFLLSEGPRILCACCCSAREACLRKQQARILGEFDALYGSELAWYPRPHPPSATSDAAAELAYLGISPTSDRLAEEMLALRGGGKKAAAKAPPAAGSSSSAAPPLLLAGALQPSGDSPPSALRASQERHLMMQLSTDTLLRTTSVRALEAPLRVLYVLVSEEWALRNAKPEALRAIRAACEARGLPVPGPAAAAGGGGGAEENAEGGAGESGEEGQAPPHDPRYSTSAAAAVGGREGAATAPGIRRTSGRPVALTSRAAESLDFNPAWSIKSAQGRLPDATQASSAPHPSPTAPPASSTTASDTPGSGVSLFPSSASFAAAAGGGLGASLTGGDGGEDGGDYEGSSMDVTCTATAAAAGGSGAAGDLGAASPPAPTSAAAAASSGVPYTGVLRLRRTPPSSSSDDDDAAARAWMLIAPPSPYSCVAMPPPDAVPEEAGASAGEMLPPASAAVTLSFATPSAADAVAADSARADVISDVGLSARLNPSSSAADPLPTPPGGTAACFPSSGSSTAPGLLGSPGSYSEPPAAAEISVPSEVSEVPSTCSGSGGSADAATTAPASGPGGVVYPVIAAEALGESGHDAVGDALKGLGAPCPQRPASTSSSSNGGAQKRQRGGALVSSSSSAASSLYSSAAVTAAGPPRSISRAHLGESHRIASAPSNSNSGGAGGRNPTWRVVFVDVSTLVPVAQPLAAPSVVVVSRVSGAAAAAAASSAVAQVGRSSLSSSTAAASVAAAATGPPAASNAGIARAIGGGVPAPEVGAPTAPGELDPRHDDVAAGAEAAGESSAAAHPSGVPATTEEEASSPSPGALAPPPSAAAGAAAAAASLSSSLSLLVAARFSSSSSAAPERTRAPRAQRSQSHHHAHRSPADSAHGFTETDAFAHLLRLGYSAPYFLQEEPDRGRCVFSGGFIPRGALVMEYAGQLVDAAEGDRRHLIYGAPTGTDLGSYVFYFSHNGRKHCIDATAERPEYGVGRIISHSRKHPNLRPQVVVVDGVPRVGLFAKRDIGFAEELAYDYGERDKSSLAAFSWLANS